LPFFEMSGADWRRVKRIYEGRENAASAILLTFRQICRVGREGAIGRRCGGWLAYRANSPQDCTTRRKSRQSQADG
jgi:hypothetical protein